MTNDYIKPVIYFESKDLDGRWLFNIIKSKDENVIKIQFRDTEYVLISDYYFSNTLFGNTKFLSNDFKSKIGFPSKSRSVPDIFNELHRNRKSVLVDSKTFEGVEFVHPILNGEYNKIFFYNCVIEEDEFENLLYLDDLEILLKCYWISCKLLSTTIRLKLPFDNNDSNQITRSFFKCVISKFNFSTESDSELILQDNEINILITDSFFIRLKNVKLKLFHHTNLDNTKNDFGFDNVTFEFNPSILRRFVFETQTVGFLNTYKQLLNNDSLYSERDNIKKYIYYFTSRKHWINKTLFTFNKGYYGILFPLIVTGLLILLKYLILLCNEELYFINNNSFVPVIYPIEMYKDIIFSDSTFKYYCVKIWLFIIEPLYIYSMYSFLTGVKRFLGFKLEL